MNDYPIVTTDQRKLWKRGLWMILMGLLYQLASTVLFCLAVIQFVLALFSDAPNPRLLAFGRSLGRFLGQIADFESFASEALPFPFSDWPPGH